MSGSSAPLKLWDPSPNIQEESNIQDFIDWLKSNRNLHFQDYNELWQWSVTDLEVFWLAIWEYFDIQAKSPFEAVLSSDPMPNAKWFSGASLNYAEHIFRNSNSKSPAFIAKSETRPLREISWLELEESVAAFANWLKNNGITVGDRVAAFMPNIEEANIAFLATCSIGAIWSSCSPDFGANSVIDRFQQIEPKILIVADGYSYNGKLFDKSDTIKQLLAAIPSIDHLVWVPFIGECKLPAHFYRAYLWDDIMTSEHPKLEFEPVAFEHPIWILYSSGTTGNPKAITHSQGGVLLEHLKYLRFHNDVKSGERYFWFSTTGWMMWNFAQAALLCGATVVLYDGSPSYPDLNSLWDLAEKCKVTHFGTSAPFIMACKKAGIEPGKQFDLNSLRSLSSTGSPLPPEGFEYVYKAINSDIWMISMSGGTDVCTAFVGGIPLLPVYEGEIQCRALGCSLFAWDEDGQALKGEVGEMVITKPMPSMPIFFWGDDSKKIYAASYFEEFPGYWRHGDWVLITERNSLVIYGRSDATLNRHGVRIGTSEIYRSLDKIPQVKESLIVNLELSAGRHFMPLFVHLMPGFKLDDQLKAEISKQLKLDYSPRHVPDEIIEVPDIPFTISGKKMEAPVKKILLGMTANKALNPDSMRNPDSLKFFEEYAKTIH